MEFKMEWEIIDFLVNLPVPIDRDIAKLFAAYIINSNERMGELEEENYNLKNKIEILKKENEYLHRDISCIEDEKYHLESEIEMLMKLSVIDRVNDE